MTRRKMLKCCECRAPAVPASGWCENDRRRRSWEHGDEATCPKCAAKLRVYVEDDYSDDMWPRVVTAQRFAELEGKASP